MTTPELPHLTKGNAKRGDSVIGPGGMLPNFLLYNTLKKVHAVLSLVIVFEGAYCTTSFVGTRSLLMSQTLGKWHEQARRIERELLTFLTTGIFPKSPRNILLHHDCLRKNLPPRARRVLRLG